MQNITIGELIGLGAADRNYAVSTNWRIDFSAASGLIDEGVLDVMSYACSSTLSDFKAEVSYAEGNIKGIPIHQAAWQSRIITDLQIEIYEPMDRSLEKALLKAVNTTAGMLNSRDIAAKSAYTISGIKLYELGNADSSGNAKTISTIILNGVQVNSVTLGDFESDDANLVKTKLSLYVHYWAYQNGNDNI